MKLPRGECGRRAGWHAVGPVVAAVLVLICVGCGKKTTPPPPVKVSFTAERLEDAVYTGGPTGSLAELTSSQPEPLPEGHRAATDETGQALLEGQLSTNDTCRIYLYQSGTLFAHGCSRSSYEGSNTVTCQEEGTAVYRECKGNLAQTGSAEVEVTGSWYTITYLPTKQLTLVAVAEGTARVTPVTRYDERTLGRPIRVGAEEFLFTAPNDRLAEIDGLNPREAHPLEELDRVIKALELEPWYRDVDKRAGRDRVPWLTGNEPPVAVIEAPTQGLVDEVIIFDGTSSVDGDGKIVSYEWDFGDGTGSRGERVGHTYSAPGEYKVSLMVTDDRGDTHWLGQAVTVVQDRRSDTNERPVAVIDAPDKAMVDEIIIFDGAGSFDPDGEVEDYEWDFGDGAGSMSLYPRHAYAEAGQYKVSLTVTDDQGASNQEWWLIEVLLDTGQAGDTYLDRAYGYEYEGAKVSVMGPYGYDDALRLAVLNERLGEHTGISAKYVWEPEFSSMLPVLAEAGDLPDVAFLSEPQQFRELADWGYLVPLWPEIIERIEGNYAPAWLELGSYQGTPFGVVHRASTKSLVWYPKEAFEEAGYEVPASWDEMLALSDWIVDDGSFAWCVGLESDTAAGWVATDWLENILLRIAGPEVYDMWVNHELSFYAGEVEDAFNVLEVTWFGMDNLVLGGRKSMLEDHFATTSYRMWKPEPSCYLFSLGNFVVDMWEEDIPWLEGNLDERVGVFGLPAIDEQWGKPLIIDSGLVVMFNDRPEVRAYLEYLTTADSVEDWARAGGGIFPHQDQNLSWYATGYERTQAELLMSAEVVRFDASDLMPPEVGSDSFPTGMMNWVDGWVLDVVIYEIENSWPYE